MNLLRLTYFVAAIVVMMFMTGCHNNGKASAPFMDFPVVEEAHWEYISDEDEIIPHPWALLGDDSTLVIAGLIDNQLLHTYDKFTGKLLGSRLRQGEGPNEAIVPYNVVIDEEGGIWMYDIRVQKYKHFNSDMVVVEKYLMTDVFLSTQAIWPICGGHYFVIASEGLGNHRMRTYNIVNSRVDSVLFTYRKVEGSFADNPDMAVRSEPVAAISPDGRHIASLSGYGVAAEFFAIEGDSIVPTFGDIAIVQEFPEINGIRQRPRDLEQLFLGFSSVFATNENVYGVYSGTKYEPYPLSSICIWEWDGTPVKMIKTDACVAGIALDPVDGTIYGVVYTPEEHERRLARLAM